MNASTASRRLATALVSAWLAVLTSAGRRAWDPLGEGVADLAGGLRDRGRPT